MTNETSTGYYNPGYRNTGYYNTGDWNTGSFHVGCFNTVAAEKAYYFNKLIDKAEWDGRIGTHVFYTTPEGK